jgi:transketolase
LRFHAEPVSLVAQRPACHIVELLGVSEQHMVTAAAGLATTGPQPYIATFASFLALLCCAHIRTDVPAPASGCG